MRAIPLTDVTVTTHATCVRRVPLFQRLTPEQQDQVGALARPVELDRGEYMGVGGSGGVGASTTARTDSAASARLAVLHTGRVAVARPLPGGGERVVRLAEAGDFVGEEAFLTGHDPESIIRAVEPTRLCTFAHDDLAPLLAAHPAIAAAMLRSLSDRLTQAERRLSLAAATGPVRVAAYLLELPGTRLADGTVGVAWPLRKKDTASLLGMTPESFSRALASLRSRGLVAPAVPGAGVQTGSARVAGTGSASGVHPGSVSGPGVLLVDLPGLEALAQS